MTLKEAIELIRPGVRQEAKIWADIGAGTGMFTMALMDILEEEVSDECTLYALDKSPHALWQLESSPHTRLEILDADFSHPLDLPELDGIVMANALHYALDPLPVFQ